MAHKSLLKGGLPTNKAASLLHAIPNANFLVKKFDQKKPANFLVKKFAKEN